MPDLAKQFAGLPLGLLVCSPIIEVAKGQAELCRVYLDYVYRLAWKEGKPDGETNLVTFNLQRPVTDGAGNISKERIQVNAPLISLVPIPSFTMQEATVQFTMDVHNQAVDTTETSKEAEASAGFSYWGFNASFTGKVGCKSTQRRSTDQSASYDITAKAIQQPPAEGMAKLNTVFASVIEPIPVSSGQ